MTAPAPGFAAPVRDAQAAFRALLEAMARPGTIVAPRAPPSPPLPPAMAALALTLLDADTPVWLDAAEGREHALAWLRFHCGCRIVAEPQAAAFVLVTAAARMPPHAALHAGSDEYPETAATVVVAVEALGEGKPLRLSGPGIDGAAILRVAGLPACFLAEREANRRLFPRGIDCILVCRDRLAALPRSTAVESDGA